MVLIKKIPTWSIVILFLVVILSAGMAGCNDEVTYDSVDCSSCYSYRPDSGNLIINISIDAENRAVPVTVYRDRMDELDVRIQDTVYASDYEVLVPLGHYYTVTAEYTSGQDTILVVDGDIIETKKAIGQCETTCWVILGGIFNVEYRKP